LALSGITALSIVLFLFVSLSIVGKMLLLRAETQKNQNPTRAKNLYEKALVIFPFDQGQWMIALTSLNDQRFPLPEALKRQAVFYNRRTPQVLSLLARNERQLNQPQEARRLYQLLTDLDPQNPDYPWQLFELALKADYFKETWAFWVRILSLACWEETAKYDQLASATCSVPLTLPPNQSQLQEAFLSYLKTLDPNRLSGPNKAFLAKAAYQLGLTALDYQQVDLALALWQTAVWLAPQWSYFHLELARLWLLTGEENKASEALQLCLQFAYAQEHCQSFLDRDMKPLRDAPVGFLQETIDASF
jgi:tetratricopeptide (TPR) repeat protein